MWLDPGDLYLIFKVTGGLYFNSSEGRHVNFRDYDIVRKALVGDICMCQKHFKLKDVFTKSEDNTETCYLFAYKM